MKKSAFLCIVAAGIGWGTSGIFVHHLSPRGFTSLQLTFVRSFTMFICMLVYALITNRRLFKISFPELFLTFGSGLAFFGTASCYFYSMTESSVSTAVVLMYTAPIFVLIYSILFLGEKLTKVKSACVFSMFVGCCLASGIIGGFRFSPAGIIFGFLSGLCYSAYNILTKIQMKKGMNPVTANLYGFLFALVAGTVTGNITELPRLFCDGGASAVANIILLGPVTAVIPYLSYSFALKWIPAGTASSLSILEPMTATVLSIMFLDEHIGILPALGIIMILTSVVVLARGKEE